MSSLNIFPTEILECITGIVETSQQMRLWLCGDRILNYKLKKGGLKRTSLCWPGRTWMPWPRSYFATYDGLVDVEWGLDIGKSLCPTLELNLLPKTLKHLDLACEDVFILLHQQNVNMNEMLPALQSLRLSGRRLREENLKNLPSNLIELHVASPDAILLSSDIFGDLPRHMARLTLLFAILDQSELENDLPSQLIFLVIDRLECNFNWLSKLPKSLKTLKITFEGFHPEWHTLPRQLEELELNSQHPAQSTLPQLPQSLRTLKMAQSGEFAADDILPLLPNNLTKFDYGFGTITLSGPQQIPPNLIDLNATVPATHPDLISFFHPNTRHIRNLSYSGPFADKLNLFPFPAKLQSLWIMHINDDICALLPPGLEKLIVGEGFITTEGASKLPKSLTYLSVLYGTFKGHKALSHLQSLSSIQFLAQRNTTLLGRYNKNWISSLLPFSSPPSKSNRYGLSTSIDVKGFNTHLTSLTVEISIQLPNLLKPFFDALPKFSNLKELVIRYFGGIESDWLSLIPKTVTKLRIRYLTDCPTAAQLTTLPQCLRYLEIHVASKKCDWTDETLQSLPRSLQEFDFHPFEHAPPNLTEEMHKYLPPNLQRTSLVFKVKRSRWSFATPLNRLYRENEKIYKLHSVED